MLNGTTLTGLSNCPVSHVITNGNHTGPGSGSSSSLGPGLGSSSSSCPGSGLVTAANSGSGAVITHGAQNHSHSNHNQSHGSHSHSHSHASSSIANNTTNPASGTPTVSCNGSTPNDSCTSVNVRSSSIICGNSVFNDVQHIPVNVSSPSLAPVLLQYSNSALSIITSMGNALGGTSNIGNEEINAKDINLDVGGDHLLTAGGCKRGCNSSGSSGNDSCSNASVATCVNTCGSGNIVGNGATSSTGSAVGGGGSIVVGLTGSMICGSMQHSSPQAPPTYVNL